VTDCHALPVGDLMLRSFNTLASEELQRPRLSTVRLTISAHQE